MGRGAKNKYSAPWREEAPRSSRSSRSSYSLWPGSYRTVDSPQAREQDKSRAKAKAKPFPSYDRDWKEGQALVEISDPVQHRLTAAPEDPQTKDMQYAVNQLRKAEARVSRITKERQEKDRRWAAYEKAAQLSFAEEKSRHVADMDRLESELREAHVGQEVAKDYVGRIAAVMARSNLDGLTLDSALGDWKRTVQTIPENTASAPQQAPQTNGAGMDGRPGAPTVSTSEHAGAALAPGPPENSGTMDVDGAPAYSSAPPEDLVVVLYPFDQDNGCHLRVWNVLRMAKRASIRQDHRQIRTVLAGLDQYGVTFLSSGDFLAIIYDRPGRLKAVCVSAVQRYTQVSTHKWGQGRVLFLGQKDQDSIGLLLFFGLPRRIGSSFPQWLSVLFLCLGLGLTWIRRDTYHRSGCLNVSEFLVGVLDFADRLGSRAPQVPWIRGYTPGSAWNPLALGALVTLWGLRPVSTAWTLTASGLQEQVTAFSLSFLGVWTCTILVLLVCSGLFHLPSIAATFGFRLAEASQFAVLGLLVREDEAPSDTEDEEHLPDSELAARMWPSAANIEEASRMPTSRGNGLTTIASLEPTSLTIHDRARIDHARAFVEEQGGPWPYLAADDPFAPQSENEGDEETDTIVEEGECDFTIFLLKVDYTPESVTVTLTSPAEIHQAIAAVQNTRDPVHARLFPTLHLCDPQPSQDFGVLVAVPGWVQHDVCVVFDLMEFDGRLFTAVAPLTATKTTLLQMCELDSTRADLYVGSNHVPANEEEIPLRIGLCLFVVPRYVLPGPYFDLANTLLDSALWADNPAIPIGPIEGCFCFVGQGGHRRCQVGASPDLFDRDELARLFGLQPTTLQVQPAVPAITDIAVHGYMCHNAWIIGEIDEQMHEASGAQAAFALVDCRAIFQGWLAVIAGDGHCLRSDIELVTFMPTGWDLHLEWLPAGADACRVEPGQVIYASYVPTPEPSARPPPTEEGHESEAFTDDEDMSVQENDLHPPGSRPSEDASTGHRETRRSRSPHRSSRAAITEELSVTLHIGHAAPIWDAALLRQGDEGTGGNSGPPDVAHQTAEGQRQAFIDGSFFIFGQECLPEWLQGDLLTLHFFIPPPADMSSSDSHDGDSPPPSQAGEGQDGDPEESSSHPSDRDASQVAPSDTPSTGPDAGHPLCPTAIIVSGFVGTSQQRNGLTFVVLLAWICTPVVAVGHDILLDPGHPGAQRHAWTHTGSGQNQACVPTCDVIDASQHRSIEDPTTCRTGVVIDLASSLPASRCFDLTGISVDLNCHIDNVMQVCAHGCFLLQHSLPHHLSLHSATAQLLALCNDNLKGRPLADVGPMEYLDAHTDGSFDGKDSAWAFVVFGWLDSQPYFIGWHAGFTQTDAQCQDYTGATGHSAIAGEYSALVWALLWSVQAPKSVGLELHSDCLVALQQANGIWSFQPTEGLASAARALQQLLCSVQAAFSGKIHHVRSHQGHPCNELADSIAKHFLKRTTPATLSTTQLRAAQAIRDGTAQWWWLIHNIARLPSLWPTAVGSSIADRDRFTDDSLPTEAEARHWFGFRDDVAQSSVRDTRVLSLRLLTVNVQTLAEANESTSAQAGFKGRAAFLREQIDDLGVHVACLQETRAAASETVTSYTHLRFCSGKDAAGNYGVECWFSRLLPFSEDRAANLFFHPNDFLVPFSDPRTLFVRFSRGGVKVLFACVHAPTTGDSQRETWWATLYDRLQQFGQTHEVVLMGDLNTHFAQSIPHRAGSLTIPGQGGIPDGLLRILHSQDLWIPSTFPEVHTGSSTTWVAPNGTASSRIDYILLPVSWRVAPGASCVQHELDWGQGHTDHFADREAMGTKQGQEALAAIWQDTVRHIVATAESASSCPTAEAVRRLKPILGPPKRRAKTRNGLPLVLRPDGLPATTPEEVEDAWINHFAGIEDGLRVTPQELAASCIQNQLKRELDSIELNRLELPTRIELEQALRDTASGRAAGLDLVPGEALHFAAAEASSALYPILLKTSLRLAEPIQFKGGSLQAAWKGKGSPALCSSHRGLLISATAGKAFHRLFRARCVPSLASVASPLQLGGLPACPVTAVSHAVRMFITAARKHKTSFAVLFLDLQEAFYRVCRPLLTGTSVDDTTVAQIAATVKLPQGVMHTLHKHLQERSIFADCGTSPWLAASMTEILDATWFRFRSGQTLVRTGIGSRPGDNCADVIFSFLFSQVLAELTRELTSKGCCTQLPSAASRHDSIFVEQVQAGESVTSVDLTDATWMDDLALMLLSDSATGIVERARTATSVLLDACLSRAMLPNLARGKTEMILVPMGKGSQKVRASLFRDKEPVLHIPATLWPEAKVRLVTSYKHLGGVLHCAGDLSREVRARVAQANDAFQKRKRYLALAQSQDPVSNQLRTRAHGVPHVSTHMGDWLAAIRDSLSWLWEAVDKGRVCEHTPAMFDFADICVTARLAEHACLPVDTRARLCQVSAVARTTTFMLDYAQRCLPKGRASASRECQRTCSTCALSLKSGNVSSSWTSMERLRTPLTLDLWQRIRTAFSCVCAPTDRLRATVVAWQRMLATANGHRRLREFADWLGAADLIQWLIPHASDQPILANSLRDSDKVLSMLDSAPVRVRPPDPLDPNTTVIWVRRDGQTCPNSADGDDRVGLPTLGMPDHSWSKSHTQQDMRTAAVFAGDLTRFFLRLSLLGVACLLIGYESAELDLQAISALPGVLRHHRTGTHVIAHPAALQLLQRFTPL
ncbi:unnamed protein product [Symbiodinium sp. CCMP2592]|nr:unnamed protein product [Symbiodinium sp. CCMP2592]